MRVGVPQKEKTQVNVDGRADALDLRLVINELLGIEPGFMCDANRDGKTNALDVQFVINILLGAQ